MPKDFDVVVRGFPAVKKAIGLLQGKPLHEAIQRGAIKAAEYARSLIMEYPGPSHQPVKWASEKQRTWYFANRAKAGVPMKYTRISDPWSQKLKHSWVVEETGEAAAVLRTPVTYAPFVQCKELQQPMHKATGWITDEEVLQRLADENIVEELIGAEIESMLEAA